MRYAILVDGGFAIKKLQKQLKSFPTATDLETEFSRVKTHPHLAGGELLRVYFYHAPPCTQTLTNPMSKATIDLSATVQFSQHKSLIDGLEMCDDVSVRLGETVARGWQLGSAAKKSLLNGTKSGIVANDLVPDVSQKGVDLRIGLDIARLSLREMVDVIVVITGDSDLVPAFRFARREGIKIYLDHMGHGVRRELVVHCDRVLT